MAVVATTAVHNVNITQVWSIMLMPLPYSWVAVRVPKLVANWAWFSFVVVWSICISVHAGKGAPQCCQATTLPDIVLACVHQ